MPHAIRLLFQRFAKQRGECYFSDVPHSGLTYLSSRDISPVADGVRRPGGPAVRQRRRRAVAVVPVAGGGRAGGTDRRALSLLRGAVRAAAGARRAGAPPAGRAPAGGGRPGPGRRAGRVLRLLGAPAGRRWTGRVLLHCGDQHGPGRHRAVRGVLPAVAEAGRGPAAARAAAAPPAGARAGAPGRGARDARVPPRLPLLPAGVRGPAGGLLRPPGRRAQLQRGPARQHRVRARVPGRDRGQAGGAAVPLLRRRLQGPRHAQGAHAQEAAQEDQPEQHRVRQVLRHQLPRVRQGLDGAAAGARGDATDRLRREPVGRRVGRLAGAGRRRRCLPLLRVLHGRRRRSAGAHGRRARLRLRRAQDAPAALVLPAGEAGQLRAAPHGRARLSCLRRDVSDARPADGAHAGGRPPARAGGRRLGPAAVLFPDVRERPAAVPAGGGGRRRRRGARLPGGPGGRGRLDLGQQRSQGGARRAAVTGAV